MIFSGGINLTMLQTGLKISTIWIYISVSKCSHQVKIAADTAKKINICIFIGPDLMRVTTWIKKLQNNLSKYNLMITIWMNGRIKSQLDGWIRFWSDKQINAREWIIWYMPSSINNLMESKLRWNIFSDI